MNEEKIKVIFLMGKSLSLKHKNLFVNHDYMILKLKTLLQDELNRNSNESQLLNSVIKNGSYINDSVIDNIIKNKLDFYSKIGKSRFVIEGYLNSIKDFKKLNYFNYMKFVFLLSEDCTIMNRKSLSKELYFKVDSTNKFLKSLYEVEQFLPIQQINLDKQHILIERELISKRLLYQISIEDLDEKIQEMRFQTLQILDKNHKINKGKSFSEFNKNEPFNDIKKSTSFDVFNKNLDGTIKSKQSIENINQLKQFKEQGLENIIEAQFKEKGSEKIIETDSVCVSLKHDLEVNSIESHKKAIKESLDQYYRLVSCEETFDYTIPRSKVKSFLGFKKFVK